MFAPLPQVSTLFATGADARAFLHAQLSNDIAHLPDDVARRAGYCSPKGRLLASLLVIPHADGYLMQVSSDIATAIARRLSMYVLRAKVRITDESATWTQYGIWGGECRARLEAIGLRAPQAVMQVTSAEGRLLVCVAPERYLLLADAGTEAVLAGGFRRVAAHGWSLAEVRAGVALIGLATQDQFVPQMANFELVGGIDFRKGCYPGQEIVARSQYLGKLKRRMYRVATDADDAAIVAPGRDVYGGEPQAAGMIVNVAPRPEGGSECLAVIQSAVAESGAPIRLGAPDGPVAQVIDLPYAL